ncbi:MAG: hypothetical protein AB1896_14845, partial [Thermodesulfobacteriota bacterium]
MSGEKQAEANIHAVYATGAALGLMLCAPVVLGLAAAAMGAVIAEDMIQARRRAAALRERLQWAEEEGRRQEKRRQDLAQDRQAFKETNDEFAALEQAAADLASL